MSHGYETKPWLLPSSSDRIIHRYTAFRRSIEGICVFPNANEEIVRMRPGVFPRKLIICRDPAEAYEDFVLKFTSMSMEEFDSYMSKACLDHIEQEAKANIFIPSAEIEDALTRENPVMQTQKYYYSYPLNNNYLSISANVMYINGSYKYVSGISGYSYGSDAYPEYRPYSISSTFSSDYEYVNVTFSCYKYTGPNSSDGITYTIIKTFKAGNGDYYG